MGTYIHFTDEQKQRANSVDLTVFLKMQGETLLTSGREKRLQSNHSITVRGNEWFDHATKEGGLAIDFVQNYYGKSFPDAVMMLLNGEQGAPYAMAKDQVESRKPFSLPPSNTDMRRVFAYLIKHRLIDREVVSFFAREKLIYESKEPSADESKEYHNAIFVGYDENGVARHAHKRGLYTEGKGFKGNIDNSNPCYSFHYMGSSERLYVFEAPIDLLSFITAHKNSDWRKHSYLALCGLSEQAIFKTLECKVELTHVVLCLDHDAAGIEASEKMEDMLAERNLSCSRLVSCFKDWNEDLKAAQNITAIPAEEHPQHQLKKEICEEIVLLLKDMNITHIEYSDGEQILKQARNQNEHPAEAVKLATAVFLCLALREYRQLGNQMTAEEIVQSMSGLFRTYQNRSRWDPKLTEAVELFSKIERPAAIIGETEKANCANGYLGVAVALLKATIKLELHEQKQSQATVLKMA
jgi:DNA primase